jgi:hypothetical protein
LQKPVTFGPCSSPPDVTVPVDVWVTVTVVVVTPVLVPVSVPVVVVDVVPVTDAVAVPVPRIVPVDVCVWVEVDVVVPMVVSVSTLVTVPLKTSLGSTGSVQVMTSVTVRGTVSIPPRALALVTQERPARMQFTLLDFFPERLVVPVGEHIPDVDGRIGLVMSAVAVQVAGVPEGSLYRRVLSARTSPGRIGGLTPVLGAAQNAVLQA